jgi:PEP-CTERM motif
MISSIPYYGLETMFTFTPVGTTGSTPEPSSLLLLGTGLLALGPLVRRLTLS